MLSLGLKYNISYQFIVTASFTGDNNYVMKIRINNYDNNYSFLKLYVVFYNFIFEIIHKFGPYSLSLFTKHSI